MPVACAVDSVHCWSSLVMSIQSYFKPKGGLPDTKRSLSTCLPTQAIALLTIKVMKKAIVDKGLGEKHGQYFIFMVALRRSKRFCILPCYSKSCVSRMTLPYAHVGNFAIKKCLLPIRLYEIL